MPLHGPSIPTLLDLLWLLELRRLGCRSELLCCRPLDVQLVLVVGLQLRRLETLEQIVVFDVSEQVVWNGEGID